MEKVKEKENRILKFKCYKIYELKMVDHVLNSDPIQILFYSFGHFQSLDSLKKWILYYTVRENKALTKCRVTLCFTQLFSFMFSRFLISDLTPSTHSVICDFDTHQCVIISNRFGVFIFAHMIVHIIL